MYTVDELREYGLLLIEYVTGSHAYGTNIPSSDRDIKGVYVMPDHVFADYRWSPSCDEVKITEDIKYYELRKFLRMLESNNPNVIEILNIPEDCILYKHPAFSIIEKDGHNLISKKCKESFAGYALAQISKAFGMDKMQNWEKERMERKDFIEFCYTFKDQGSQPISTWLDSHGLKEEYCGLSAIPHMRYAYGLYYDFGEHFRNHSDADANITESCYSLLKLPDAMDRHILQEVFKTGDAHGYCGISNGQSVVLSSIPMGVKPLCHLQINMDGWQSHCKDMKRFDTWKRERNEERWIDVKGHGQKIDGKNMLHMVRLLNMSEDVALGKGIVVRRPEAADLIKIRRGEVSLQKLLDDAKGRIKIIDEMYERSDLPEIPPPGLASYMNDEIRKIFLTNRLK